MIRNIWAVGRNYREHAHELGNSVPTTPLVFLKAGSSAVQKTPSFSLPPWVDELHHEIEIALEFNERLEIARAAVALDLTDRKAQSELKARGEPWTLAKTFVGACPLSPFFPIASLADIEEMELVLEVNGELRQRDRGSSMIFKPAVLAEYVRSRFPVCPGDLLLTGTPSGVGPLRRGDQVRAQILGRVSAEWRVT